MKVIVLVALFAFVAVQVCQSAPLPEDDKPEQAEQKDVPAAPAAPAAVAVETDAVAASTPAENKAELTSEAAASKPTDAPPAEEKKE